MTRFSVGYISKTMTISINKAQQKLNYTPTIDNYQGFKLYKVWLDVEK